jgi:hypothetical protein
MNVDQSGTAFPIQANGYAPEFGLTKREYFAGLAMQGLVIKRPDGLGSASESAVDEAARVACLYADALLAKLAKAQP